MEFPKLYIESKRFTAEAAVVSMRIPKDMIQSRVRQHCSNDGTHPERGHDALPGVCPGAYGDHRNYKRQTGRISSEELAFAAGAKANTRKS